MLARVTPTPAASPTPVTRTPSKRSPPSLLSASRHPVVARIHHDHRHPERFYELRPPDPLPTVDLSLSLESRFLSRAALNRMKRFVRRHRAISIASWLALAAYFAAVLVPVAIGRVIALACIMFWIPVMFCSCINTSTFFVLGVVMGGDLCALAALAAWAGVQSNIMINANIRGVKVWAILNVVGVINCSLTWVTISLDLIDEVHDFPLVRLKAHELPALAFVASGLLTVTVLVARNVFRKHSNRSVIECVSYRVNLRFQVCFVQQQRAVSSVLPPSDPARPEYEKTMKYTKRIGVVDAQCTVLEQLRHGLRHHVLGVPSSPGVANTATGGGVSSSGRHVWTNSFAYIGVLVMLATVCSVFVDVYVPIFRAPVCQIFALALTAAYCCTFALHYQCELFRELCACFDVLFLLSQSLVVHASVCFIFEFSQGCVVVLTSWLWCLWVLFLDALPPVVKAKLGVLKGFVLVVVVVLIGSSFGLIYLLVFADSSKDVHDRVLSQGRVLGKDVHFRLVPIFHNCFATAFLLVLRLLWRIVVNDRDVLLMLDGAVVYENYLRMARTRDSRRWWSFAERMTSPSIEQCRLSERVHPSSTPSTVVEDTQSPS